MLSQRLVRAAAGAATPRTALRAAFSTTGQPCTKTPGMADISASPQSVEEFNKRQQAFREQLVDQQSSGSNASSAGSKADAKEPTKKAGPLTNLIYGTKEGRELEAQLEASFSQVLARGKYVHTISFHEVKQDRLEEYVDLISNWYPKMAALPENKVHLVGSWRTEIGDTNTFGEYTPTCTCTDSSRRRSSAASSTPGRTPSCRSSPSGPRRPRASSAASLSCARYTLHPGNLLEWETHWRRGLKARREVMEGVGAWFVQIGDLNTVHHLWQFANLEERKIRREQSWQIEGWSETVHKTVPLIQKMESRILTPMPWSPVQ
ncbi:NipSnap2 [Verticillium alfalfae VaMs.102]|uniref:NipSnap2 n=1 Tax=Verticillium alfalfae (strain VaMs.102 / ATCC MYA-4576 / FGSC 10136) TaxID=526221 RepID=C9S9U5_VERA1|nr:NipSnap2 [Verticillium alfalfae VaMs.102]EEY16158.1 NipSnap2 [Verticillium alfalfae VaMs.102]